MLSAATHLLQVFPKPLRSGCASTQGDMALLS